MDKIFLKYIDFVAVYIDDILVFGKTKVEHISHLKLVLAEFKRHGIIVLKKKIEIAKPFIKFLGVWTRFPSASH